MKNLGLNYYLNIFLQGLYYLHSKGKMHRDIKVSENLREFGVFNVGYITIFTITTSPIIFYICRAFLCIRIK